MVPPPASMIKTCSPGCEHVKQPAVGEDEVTDPEVFACLSMGSAKVETCFTFSHKVDARTPSRRVRDDARLDCGVSQLRSLWAIPSVGMGQNQLNVV